MMKLLKSTFLILTTFLSNVTVIVSSTFEFSTNEINGNSRSSHHHDRLRKRRRTAEAAEAAETVWSSHEQQSNNISLDESIIYGKLDNGLQYYIMPNTVPPNQMELKLHINVGANFETDNIRGLAHFLEHMMFQTTKHWPQSGTLIPTMQRLGMGFG